jgi:hypothetical protein
MPTKGGLDSLRNVASTNAVKRCGLLGLTCVERGGLAVESAWGSLDDARACGHSKLSVLACADQIKCADQKMLGAGKDMEGGRCRSLGELPD